MDANRPIQPEDAPAHSRRLGWRASARRFALDRRRNARTERIISERTSQLRSSEAGLKAVLDNALDAMITMDDRGVIELFNPAAEAMFGHTLTEVIGKSVRVLMPEPLYSLCDKDIADFIQGNKAKVVGKGHEVTARRKDGEEFPIHLSINEFELEGGRRFVGTIHDLTQRKKNEEALRIRDHAIETSEDGIAITDLAGNITYVNRAMLNLLGYSSLEEVMRKHATAFWADEDKARDIGKALKEEGRWSGELLAKRKDGTTFPVALSAHTATDEQGNPLCLMAAGRDITERKENEEKLAQYQQHLEKLVEQRTQELKRANAQLQAKIADLEGAQRALRRSEASLEEAQRLARMGNWEWDLETNELYCSEGVLRQFGMNFEELDNNYQSFLKFVHPEDRAATEDKMRKALREKLPCAFDNRIVLPDGDIRVVRQHVDVQLSEDGRPLRMVGTVQDITEQKRMEQSHRQAQRLEALGTLAGGIAHDFNNILGAILGFTDMAYKDAEEGSRLREDLGEVLNAAHRAADLVSQIVTFGRQTKEERRPIHLHHIIKEALRLLEATLPASIEIREYLETDSGAVLGNPSQIHQVIMNLCTNAFQAMKDKGGRLFVGLTRTEIDQAHAANVADLEVGPYVKITVADTGHGMDRKTLERIYDPFFTTKQAGEGTGLGLSTVHGIVQIHGGAITAQSAVGEGTAFNIYLPRVEKLGGVREENETCLTEGGTERILVVDDEQTLVRFMEQALKRLGYSVTGTHSGVDALSLFRARPDAYDLIVTDLNMPKLSGERLTEEILRTREDIPIIVATAFGENLSPDRAARLGVCRILSKPYTTQRLAEAVREVLDHPKAVQNKRREAEQIRHGV